MQLLIHVISVTHYRTITTLCSISNTRIWYDPSSLPTEQVKVLLASNLPAEDSKGPTMAGGVTVVSITSVLLLFVVSHIQGGYFLWPSHWWRKIWYHANSCVFVYLSLQWRPNERDGVSNHRLHDYLLRCRSSKTSKLRVTGLCVGNSPMTGEFPAHRTSNAEDVSIWWRIMLWVSVII